MCGILLHYGDKIITIDRNIMPERGPDSWDTYQAKTGTGYLTMFHSRLSIIGLGDQGKQPFQKIEGKILIYNGEIYNYKELRNELGNEFSINFSTTTDTEVLYYGLIYWGIDKTLNKINGVFAFCFYDSENKVIWTARDNLGVKPLYYYHKDGKFAASSECKSLFYCQVCNPEIRRDLLGDYFANLWIYEPNTLFKDIYKLEAGCYLSFELENQTLTTKRYWSLSHKIQNRPNIKDIINLQTVTSDVKVSAYLSGGIDSSIIACALKDNDIAFLHLDLGGDENSRVERLKKLYQLDIFTVNPKTEYITTYEYLVKQIEEPIADPAVIPSYELAYEAKKMGSTVMLSGMGGDEIDSGYPKLNRIKYLYLLRLLKFIPKKFVKHILKNRYSSYERILNFLSDTSPANFYALNSFFSKNEIDDLVLFNWYDDYKTRINKLVGDEKGLKRYYTLDFKGFLSSHNTIYSDKTSMAASVEVRVPLLDKNLANYFYKDIHLLRNSRKRRLKQELKQYIGKENYKVKKEGFGYPVREWLQNKINWQEIIDTFEKLNLLNVEHIRQLVTRLEHDNGKDIEMKLWAIYTLFLWIKVFNITN
jgi:asparagine synthase (glutamine-hydrolysing)